MRILSGAVIVAVGLTMGCGNRDDNVQTPPAQAPAAQAPPPAAAPAAPPAGRAGGAAAGGAQAGGRAGGAAAGGAQAAGRAGGAGGNVTIEQHEAAMKQIAQANGGLQKLVKANDLMGAATQAETLATQFTTVEQFWSQRNKPDAVKLAQTARQGAMDAAAAAKAGDQMKAQMAAGNVGGACKQCHGTYREGDAQTGFRIAASAGITQ
jgi:cytochrome c556